MSPAKADSPPQQNRANGLYDPSSSGEIVAEQVEAHDDLVSALDAGSLDFRYWWTFFVFSTGFALEYFDFYIVGFLVAVLGAQWHLTYMESALILLSAGVGSIVGALCWGTLCDLLGRKKLIVAGTFVCGMSAAAVAFIPDGAWWIFALLRFGVGMGMAGAATAQIALLVEFTPTRFRTLLTGLPIVAATLGTLLASATAALLLNRLGWRGLAALGGMPAGVGLLIAFSVPESVRWLVSQGRFNEASRILGRNLGTQASTAVVKNPPNSRRHSIPLSELYWPPRRFWVVCFIWICASTANYGVYLWGPTIVSMLLGISVKGSARYFVYVAAAGVIGKIIFALLPNSIGRRRSGELHGYGMGVTLCAVALLYNSHFLGIPLFVPLLAMGAVFFDGQFCNITPYTAEIFPVRLAGRGTGLAQAANGVGKILGPLGLALIAGARNPISPQATTQAIFPCFLFLASCGMIIGVCFTFFAPETKGRPLVLQ